MYHSVAAANIRAVKIDIRQIDVYIVILKVDRLHGCYVAREICNRYLIPEDVVEQKILELGPLRTSGIRELEQCARETRTNRVRTPTSRLVPSSTWNTARSGVQTEHRPLGQRE